MINAIINGMINLRQSYKKYLRWGNNTIMLNF